MANELDLWKKPTTKENYLLIGWRQWADAGAVSSGLPQYLVQQLGAEHIGAIRPDGFYLFQVPGTYDLVRPVVRFEEGYPSSLETPHNEIYYANSHPRGILIFLGDEPHMDIERYVGALLSMTRELGVKRIVAFGGVYGELPYAKERMISANYSMRQMKSEINHLAVNFSDYQGGASIGSYVCRRAGDQGIEYVGLYAFVPAYDFTAIARMASAIRLENDYMAWLGVLRRVDFMLKLNLNFADLEQKSKQLIETMDAKVEELDREVPQLKLRERINELSAKFKETPFLPLDDVLEEELRRLLEKYDPDDPMNSVK